MSDPAHSNGHAALPGSPAAASEAETSSHAAGMRKPFKPQYPLTSWADTKQNIACIGFVLGCAFTLAISNGVKLLSSEGQDVFEMQDLSTKERFWNTVTGPKLGIYIALLVLFHMMEFLTTAIYNPSKATVRCEKPFVAHLFI